MEEGALELASSEVKFELDTDKQTATDMMLYTPYDTNSMVEEFMLLANVAVA
jgi:exosome complex exonuclease DIS3/RRP44|eukprot:CAMPEP_0168315948 /NCGR_PEP_ID=MMETSP0210-20121227/13418_1 /TAXON_ID=40633 /ORGANISM="Condylostoma magnum, Strain COL2" /LENGTH=51 /DNA_ID=CAMNT_0008292949 /DNA_START=1721 /DNA_END=1879 /DNA_ORIENTATION=+